VEVETQCQEVFLRSSSDKLVCLERNKAPVFPLNRFRLWQPDTPKKQYRSRERSAALNRIGVPLGKQGTGALDFREAWRHQRDLPQMFCFSYACETGQPFQRRQRIRSYWQGVASLALWKDSAVLRRCKGEVGTDYLKEVTSAVELDNMTPKPSHDPELT
jgi:hypothetical protein